MLYDTEAAARAVHRVVARRSGRERETEGGKL
jgi:hypothetical protein